MSALTDSHWSYLTHLWVAFADSVFLLTLYVQGALSKLHRLHGFAPSHFAFLILHRWHARDTLGLWRGCCSEYIFEARVGWGKGARSVQGDDDE